MSIIHFSSVINATAAGGIPALALSGSSLSDTTTQPTDPVINLIFATDGLFTFVQGALQTPVPGQWAVTQTTDVGDQFEIRFTEGITVGNGIFTGDTFDVWHPLSSQREKGFTLSGAESSNTIVTVEIGLLGQNSAIVTANFGFTITKNAAIQAGWPAQDFDEQFAGTAAAGLIFNPNGTGSQISNSATFNWGLPTTATLGDDYEIRGELQELNGDQSVQGPTLGANTWHSLSSIREWRLEKSGTGQNDARIIFSIRRTGTVTVLASKEIQFIAAIGMP